MAIAARCLKMVIPKGRLQEKVVALLERVGVGLSFSSRSYRPVCSDSELDIKVLKSQNIPPLVALGRHDCGFTGFDWVVESGADRTGNIESVLDLGYNPVRIVVAVPDDLAESGEYKKRQIIVASEYPVLAQRYLDERKLDAILVKTYGATEAMPPEDADMIIDNTSTGATLTKNRLTIVDEVMRSTTHMVACSASLKDPWKKEKLDQLVMLIRSTMHADAKVLLEMNVDKADFESLVNRLPAMRAPTVSPLYREEGFAVKVAVPKKEVAALIPQLKAAGARDILEYRLEKLVP
ncbi:MAG: ATP phosphoribosyltransferase [Candidatus Melainabacteria bacterium]